MSEILFAMIFGHLLADSILQVNCIIKMKNAPTIMKVVWGHILHISTHLITYLVIFGIVKGLSSNIKIAFDDIFYPLIIIVLAHFIIDFAKTYICKLFQYTKVKAYTFVIDQILHVTTILVVFKYNNISDYDWTHIIIFMERLLFAETTNITNLDKFMLVGSVIILTTHFCGYFFEIILENFRPMEHFTDKKSETVKQITYDDKGNTNKSITIEDIIIKNEFNTPSIKVGKYIGMLERILIVFLVATGAVAGITFLIAIKALTRFKQFEDKSFAEYYLVGSLLSILFGIISGYIVLRILT